jgi:hypothetical protein
MGSVTRRPYFKALCAQPFGEYLKESLVVIDDEYASWFEHMQALVRIDEQSSYHRGLVIISLIFEIFVPSSA